MPSLKALRTRINSVKSTQKITSAMKMVAASKLRRAQAQAEAARPYAERMDRMLRALAASVADMPTAPPLLVGTGKDKTHLLIAGHRRPRPGRRVQRQHRPRDAQPGAPAGSRGQDGQDPRRRPQGARLPAPRTGQPHRRRHLLRRQAPASNSPTRRTSAPASPRCSMPARSTSATIVYNRFQSVISQVVTEQQLIPAPPPPEGEAVTIGGAIYDSSRTRKPSWRGCCRRRWRSRSIARCWKAPPASTARA